MAKRKKISCEMSVIFGDEPKIEPEIITSDNYNSQMINLLQWYGQYAGVSNPATRKTYHKSWLKEWAKAHKIKSRSFSIPTQGISVLAALARVHLRGFPLQKKDIQKLTDAFTEWKPEPKKETMSAKERGERLSLLSKIKNEDALKSFLTKFDLAIDAVASGEKDWDIQTTEALTAVQASELLEYYKEGLAEFQDVYENQPEGYSFGKQIAKRMINLHQNILEEISLAQARGTVKRKAKTVRKKSNKPASTLVQNLQYLPVHNEYKLVSINPEKLIGANIAWVFDTRHRVLKVYETKGAAGIQVSGTTLKNIVGKQKIIRKPEEFFSDFVSLTKIRSQKAFDAIAAKEKSCTGRMNKDIIILKVY